MYANLILNRCNIHYHINITLLHIDYLLDNNFKACIVLNIIYEKNIHRVLYIQF